MDQWPVRILVYGAGEAIDGASALSGDIKQQLARLQEICTNQIVAATAQLDASDVTTTRFVLDPSHSQPVLSLPNVNVGDPAQLLDFVKWSIVGKYFYERRGATIQRLVIRLINEIFSC